MTNTQTTSLDTARVRASTVRQMLHQQKVMSREAARQQRQSKRDEQLQRRAHRRELLAKLDAAITNRLDAITNRDSWTQGTVLRGSWRFGWRRLVAVRVGSVNGWSCNRDRSTSDVYLSSRGAIFQVWFVDLDDDYSTCIGWTLCRPRELTLSQLEQLLETIKS